MIFDEIDTGISGRAARKIGVQLKNVSKLRQVICITHLAQIAALANNHLLITKAQKAFGAVGCLLISFNAVAATEGADVFCHKIGTVLRKTVH